MLVEGKQAIRGWADFHLLKARAGRSERRHQASAGDGGKGWGPPAQMQDTSPAGRNGIPGFLLGPAVQDTSGEFCTFLGSKGGNLRGEDLSIKIGGFRQGLKKACAFSLCVWAAAHSF